MKFISIGKELLPLALSIAMLPGAIGCSGTGSSASTGGHTATGGATTGGLTSSGGTTDTGGVTNTGGSTNTGGATVTGGATKTGGSTVTGGVTVTGGSTVTGGATSTGGSAKTGGATATGGNSAPDGGPTPDARPLMDTIVRVDSAPATDGGGNCPTTMPAGGKTYTGKSVYGTANGLGYGIWTNGVGGDITVFTDAHAFSASWSESQDFLAHLGLDFRPAKDWTTLGTIAAEYSEVKSGTAGGFSMIGMYGWTNSPCVEWYINEDSWKGLGGGGTVTADIDGGTYYLKTLQTTGTGGANACESGHTGSWTQMISTRKGSRTCGTVTISDHFAAWEKQGWKLGVLTSAHINVEVGGGTGKIDFPLANVTVANK